MKLYTTMLVGALLLSLVSCIRDELEACPPLSVRIGIADKNYANIDEVERVTGLDHRLPEDRPFKHYIQKLFYVLYDLDNQEAVKIQRLSEVGEDGSCVTVNLPESLDFGRYVFVAWGNIGSEDVLTVDGTLMTCDLHKDQLEGNDVYMICDTLLYDENHYDYEVGLKRVKGKLLIEAVDLPGDVTWSRKVVDHLYGSVDSRFRYADSGTGIVTAEAAFSASGQGSSMIDDTYLAPTIQGKESTVSLNFYTEKPDGLSLPTYVPDNIDITLKRNEITVLRYVYDDSSGTFDIYTLLNDRWQVVNDMVLE